MFTLRRKIKKLESETKLLRGKLTELSTDVYRSGFIPASDPATNFLYGGHRTKSTVERLYGLMDRIHMLEEYLGIMIVNEPAKRYYDKNDAKS